MILDVVVGGQFGSEAKGHVTKQVIVRHLNQGRRVLNIRVAGPNAGHCAYDASGNKYALRTVPMGAVIDNPDVRLHIAAGSEVEPQVLFDEIALLKNHGIDVTGRLTIDPEATVLTDDHKVTETGMHERIGSTGKGIGAARADRIMRTAKRVCDDIPFLDDLATHGVYIVPIEQNDYVPGSSDAVVIEGTQGYGLGLHAGFYPQCTSSDTRAIDFLAMAGFMPWAYNVQGFTVYVVARVYPIRVAGNSGPLQGETSWEELGLPEEFTTVTKKVRRVGEWDSNLIKAAVLANGGRKHVRLALTMLDQKFSHLKDVSTDDVLSGENDYLTAEVHDFLSKVIRDAGAPLAMITTGEDSAVWL